MVTAIAAAAPIILVPSPEAREAKEPADLFRILSIALALVFTPSVFFWIFSTLKPSAFNCSAAPFTSELTFIVSLASAIFYTNLG